MHRNWDTVPRQLYRPGFDTYAPVPVEDAPDLYPEGQYGNRKHLDPGFFLLPRKPETFKDLISAREYWSRILPNSPANSRQSLIVEKWDKCSPLELRLYVGKAFCWGYHDVHDTEIIKTNRTYRYFYWGRVIAYKKPIRPRPGLVFLSCGLIVQPHFTATHQETWEPDPYWLRDAYAPITNTSTPPAEEKKQQVKISKRAKRKARKELKKRTLEERISGKSLKDRIL